LRTESLTDAGDVDSAPMRRSCSAVVLALFLASAQVVAAEGEPIHLEYRAFDRCPDESAFEAQVRAHTPRVSFAEAAARTFEVRIDAGTASVVGRLVVRRADHVEGTRQIRAPSCDEAAEALALMVALAVDPSAVLIAPVAKRAGDAGPPPNAGPETSNAPPPPPVTMDTGSTAREVEVPRAVAEPGARRTLYVGMDVAVATDVMPSATVGLSPYAGWSANRRGFIEPGVRLAFVHGSSATAAAAGGTASFEWNVGRADGCLLSWPGGSARLLACGRAEAGVLDASGADVSSPRGATRGWLSAGPLLRFEWTIVSTLFLDADAAAMFHITDNRFYFSPDATIYVVPVAGLEAATGLGLHFL
jgi:hypothetical protein